ncbi:hypothetical protein GR160_07765 [Flavobacterium sp. Sd200]|uniref:hypothetical protein n=1 Tax=Flavobacterium sp. Sd200 TaxID=2692211 RepID=UPI00136FB519|nr:hypothetical protein [Flavobacterium sp. Sd200]MXN91125.1 hypothetical protein [Flavobacterium sp. Sd200]
MKYYQIDVSSEPQIIGVSNGIHQVEIDKKAMQQDDAFNDFLNFFSTQNTDFWKTQDKIKSLKIPVIQAKLLKKAKITDIMGYRENISFIKSLHSEKYIKILEAFDIGNCTTFEVNINDVQQKYFMMFIETIRLDEINYKKSVVITGHKATNNIIYHKIDNRDEYLEFRQKNVLGGFEKIAISKIHFGKDIINIQATPRPFYSEKLIDFLLDCKITGLEVKYNNSIELDFY